MTEQKDISLSIFRNDVMRESISIFGRSENFEIEAYENDPLIKAVVYCINNSKNGLDKDIFDSLCVDIKNPRILLQLQVIYYFNNKEYQKTFEYAVKYIIEHDLCFYDLLSCLICYHSDDIENIIPSLNALFKYFNDNYRIIKLIIKERNYDIKILFLYFKYLENKSLSEEDYQQIVYGGDCDDSDEYSDGENDDCDDDSDDDNRKDKAVDNNYDRKNKAADNNYYLYTMFDSDDSIDAVDFNNSD